MPEPAIDFTGWALYDIKAWVVIPWAGLLNLQLPTWITNLIGPGNGIVLDTMSCTTDFGLNEIPTANCSIAIGRRMDNPSLISVVHMIVQQFKLFLPASIYMSAKLKSANAFSESWPVNNDGTARKFRIFDGYITGSGFRKTSQGAELSLFLTHWLSDLNFSSVLSRSSNPQNPMQMSYDPSLPGMPNAGAVGAIGDVKHGTPFTQAQAIINVNAVINDLWGAVTSKSIFNPTNVGFSEGRGGIKLWLTELSKQDRINWNQIRRGTCTSTPTNPLAAVNTNYRKNIEALAALKRIEPLTVDGVEQYIDGVPLAMDATRPGIANIAQQVATAIGAQTPNALVNHTMWDKLVGEFGSELQFALVPQVEKALIVPFSPTLRGDTWQTIWAHDYDYIETNDNIIRPLRGVGLFATKVFSTGAGTSLVPLPVIDTIGGYYENPDRRNGMVIIKRLPPWLANAVIANDFKAMNTPGVTFATSFSVPFILEAEAIVQPATLLNNVKSLWCDYARALYTQEVLRGRQGRISGRLRFDISPGSMVKIEEPTEKFVEKILTPIGYTKGYYYAQVIRVSVVINSEAQKAGTSLQFAFTRTEAENKDDSYSYTRHPIWKNDWLGAPLVNEAEFYP